jgi:Matrixin
VDYYNPHNHIPPAIVSAVRRYADAGGRSVRPTRSRRIRAAAAGDMAAPSDSYSQSIPYGDLSTFLDAARRYWARMLPGRHVPGGPSNVQFVTEDEMRRHPQWDPNSSAYGDVNGNRIWLKRSFWDQYHDTPSDRATLGTVVIHEVGHNLGLDHSPKYHVMTAYTPPPEVGGTDAVGNPYASDTHQTYVHGYRLQSKYDARGKRLTRGQKAYYGALAQRINRDYHHLRYLGFADPNLRQPW